MTGVSQFEESGWRFTLVPQLGPERALLEWRASAAGYSLPMTHLAEWARSQRLSQWYLSVEDAQGRCRGGVAIQSARSRAVPGFRILRVERLGGGVDHAAFPALIRALAAIGRAIPRVLRLHLELFSEREGVLDRHSGLARESAFIPAPIPRCYAVTSLIDLRTELDSVLMGFHRTARQNIRAAGKLPIEVRPVDTGESSRILNRLLGETLARTGGRHEVHDWSKILRYSRMYPDRSRVTGLYLRGDSERDRLLAFAWACAHGDHVQYATAASTRATPLRIPMAYPLAWDLIQWAHGLGASFFDFGGLSAGSHASGDPLGGISDFKRSFRGATCRVGAEWVLEPNKLAARAERIVTRLKGRG